MDVVLPGDTLGTCAEFEAGQGTYISGSQIVAAVAGRKEAAPAAASGGRPTLSVQHASARGGASRVPPPQVGDAVIARVTRITHMATSCDILVLNGAPVAEAYSGIIRRENVREGQIDAIVMSDMFRPGDLLLAEVASLGDARSYFLSTVKTEHGVVYAKAEGTGEVMVAASFETMVAPSSNRVEKRKVAKVTEHSVLGSVAAAATAAAP